MSPSSRRPTARLPFSSVISPLLLGGFFVLTVLLAGLLVPAEAAVTYFYVSPTGSDSNAGTRDAPWKTLQHAAEAAKPGNMVRVMKGTYEPFTIANKGQHFDEGSAQNQTFLAIQPDLGVQPYEVIVDGGGAAACVTVKNSDSVIVSGMTLNNCQQGIRNSGSTNTTFRNLVMQDRQVDCIVYVTAGRPLGCDGKEIDPAIPPQQEHAAETPPPPAPTPPEAQPEEPQAEEPAPEQPAARDYTPAPDVAAHSDTPQPKAYAPNVPPSQPDVPAPSSRKECANLRITASNYEMTNIPVYARDNNLNTRWAVQGKGQWIQFDLGSVMPVDEVGIAWFRGTERTANFAVDVSADGASWSRVYQGTSSGRTNDIQTYDFSAPDSRYVRIVGYGNTQHDWLSITEVAFDKALADGSASCAGGGFASSGVSLAGQTLGGASISLPVCTAPASGKSYYVAPDGRGDCSTTSPCALKTALSKAGAGDEVVLKDGSYNEQLVTRKGGSPNNPLVIRAEHPQQAVISPQKDMGRTALVILQHSYVTLQGIKVDGHKTGQGIKLGAPGGGGAVVQGLIVEGNRVTNVGGAGIGAQKVRDVIWRYNVIENTGYAFHYGEGFYIGANSEKELGIQNAEVYGNLLRNNVENGIETKPTASNIFIHHNIIENLTTAKAHGAHDAQTLGSTPRGKHNMSVLALRGTHIRVTDNILRNNEGGDAQLAFVNSDILISGNVIRGDAGVNNRAIWTGTWGGVNGVKSHATNNTLCSLSTYVVKNSAGADISNNRINAPVSACAAEEARILSELHNLPHCGGGSQPVASHPNSGIALPEPGQ